MGSIGFEGAGRAGGWSHKGCVLSGCKGEGGGGSQGDFSLGGLGCVLSGCKGEGGGGAGGSQGDSTLGGLGCVLSQCNIATGVIAGSSARFFF